MTRPPNSEQQVKNLSDTIIANLVPNLKPALRAQDGAIFYGSVRKLNGNQYRATFGARLDNGNITEVEQSRHSLHNTESEARNRIELEAAIRGFEKWYDETQTN